MGGAQVDQETAEEGGDKGRVWEGRGGGGEEPDTDIKAVWRKRGTGARLRNTTAMAAATTTTTDVTDLCGSL